MSTQLNHFYRRHFVLLITFLLSANALQAQFLVDGTVKDDKGEALPYANLLLLNRQDSSLVKGTITDTNGNFTLENIREGSYLVSARMIGYQTFTSAPINVNQNLRLDEIRVSEASTELDEVVVKATRPMMEVTPNALVVNVENSPILQNGNARDLLEKSPGVTIDQNGNISVKGKSNVLVYIDGKQTYLSDADLAQLLETTTADNIAKVEIMDNPPAKYDAEGNAGIINIVRKKPEHVGFNGRASLGMGYGRYPKVNPGINLNYRTESVNVFGNYNYYYNQRFQNNNIFRRLPTTNAEGEPAETLFDQLSERVMESKTHNFRSGADWYISPKTTLGFLLSGNIGTFYSDGENETRLDGYFTNPYNRLEASDNSGNSWDNLTYNINFRHDFSEKANLSLDADYVSWDKDGFQRNDNYFFSNEGVSTEAPLLVRTFNDTRIDIMALQADYSSNIFGDWGLEAGLKSSLVKTDNLLDFNTLEDDQLVNDDQRSNQFQYDENIHAAYINLSKKFNESLSMEAGLRSEYTASEGYSVTLDSTASREYVNLFPSASLSYAVSEKHQLSASYSRRIDRPNYGNLNPFEYFLDRFTFERGNPFLNPQYTDAYALNYGFSNAVFVTLNYNHTRDAISQVLEQDEASQTTYQTTTNLDDQRHYSVNIAAPLPITQWWVMNLNLTSFYNTIDSDFVEGRVDKSRLSYRAQAQSQFSLPGNVKLELMGMYMSPQLWGMFEIQEMYQVDAGVSKSFGKLRVQASLDDIFNIRDSRVKVNQGNIDTYVVNQWESRVFRINLSYTFGNDKVKQSRRRNTASDDLRQRAN